MWYTCANENETNKCCKKKHIERETEGGGGEGEWTEKEKNEYNKM